MRVRFSLLLAEILRMVLDMTERTRSGFLARVDASDDQGCWPWSGYCMPNGYGYLRINTVSQYAHRVAWMIEHKRELGPGEVVRHTCDVRNCCRPEHLQLGTVRDNNLDTVRRGRSKRTVLSEEQVRDMRRRALRGERHAALAARFGCSESNVSFVVRGVSWAWLDQDDNAAFLPHAQAARKGATPSLHSR